MLQKLKLVGRITGVLKKADGSIETFERNNLIVDTGVDFVCDCLGKPSGRPSVLSYIGVGTGLAVADHTDTDLETPLTRVAATYAHTGSTDFFTMTATFGAGVGTGDLTEAGMFNAASSGTMMNRVVFSSIPKEAGDSLDITFTVTLTPS